MSRRAVQLVSALIILLVCWTTQGCRRQSGEGPPSIHAFPDVQYISGEAWYEFTQQHMKDRTGWVLLPEPIDHPPYVSGIEPFERGFVRPDVCGECHQDYWESFQETAHFRTAMEATRETVLGSFEPGENVLKTRDPDLFFEMLADEQGLRQRLTVRREGEGYTHEIPIDIVTGSGNHGQSYLYWHGDELYQSPVSYFSEIDSWVNSPGFYKDATADFARAIGDRCLDCHATYFASAPDGFNRYDRNNYILGVTCVRCHGSGWAHVQYHRHHPDEDEARYITNPGQFSRELANDICSQCHSGGGQLHEPAFTYQPGEPLSEYITLDFSGENPHNDDPHAANQLARLMKSRCFTESDRLTCFTCHDPHTQERGELAAVAHRCATCHPTDACRLYDELGTKLTDHCVSCHMPSRRDAETIMETPNADFLPLLRDHFIQARPAGSESIVEEVRGRLERSRRFVRG